MRFATAMIFACLACGIAHAEKKIYACKDAAGNGIFTPIPCGSDAKELHVDPGSPATPEPRPSKPNGALLQANQLQDISDDVADSNCRRDAQSAVYYPSDNNVRDLERRKENIVRDAGYANNNLAGAVWEQGLRKQIGDMEIAITQERTRITQARDRADETYRKAIADCDKRKSDQRAARAASSVER